jgi:oligopeptide transport system substrate-binding protein
MARGILLFAFLLSWLFSACTGPGGPKAGVLRIQLPTEPVSLDPSLAEDGAALRVMTATWWGLDRLANWEVSDGGKKYVFRLKKDVRWSDGRYIEGEDFVTGIRRSLAPETASKLAPMLYPILGARAFHEGKSKEIPGLNEQGDYVVIDLERKTPYFPLVLGLSVAFPQRPDVLAAHGGKWPADGPSTGPYHVTRYELGKKIVVARTGTTALHGVKEVEFLLVADESAAVSLFERGGLDVLGRVPTLELERLKKKGVVRTDPFVATYYIGFNVKKKPADQLGWRRAVARAINKPEIAQAVGTGETPARSWIPPGIEGFEPWKKPPEEHSKIADLAQVPASFDSSARNQLVMEKIQDDVARFAGIQLSLTNHDWKSYIHELQTDPAPVFRFAWLTPFADPVPHLQVFTTGNPNNYTGWSDARYDRLVHEVEGLAPGAERDRAIAAAQKILVDDEVVIVPIYHYVQNHGVSARVKNFKVTPFGGISFDEIQLSD